MGHRLEVYANPAHADEIIRISQSFGIPAQIVGRVDASATKKLTISSPYGEFIYE